MLAVKVIICVLTFVALFIARVKYETKCWQIHISSFLVSCAAGILGISFSVKLITMNCDLFTIFEIFMFFTVCLCILKHIYSDNIFSILKLICIIGLYIPVTVYFNGFEKCESPDVAITSSTVICAKDNSSVTGSIIYVHGSVSEEDIYKYYYQSEDGGIKQGTIPVDSTTIYFVKDGKKTYLETIVTTEYWLNNYSPSTRFFEISETTYKLYIYEDSVMDVYEFNEE